VSRVPLIIGGLIALVVVVAGAITIRASEQHQRVLSASETAYREAKRAEDQENNLLYKMNHASHAFQTAYARAIDASETRHRIHDDDASMLKQARIERAAVSTMDFEDTAQSDAALRLIVAAESRLHFSATDARSALRKLRLDRADALREWDEAIGDIVDILEARERGDFQLPRHDISQRYDESTRDYDRARLDLDDFNAQIQRILDRVDDDAMAKRKAYIAAGGRP
jgi:hypothetical protein